MMEREVCLDLFLLCCLPQTLSGNKWEQREQLQKHWKSLVMRASNEMIEKLIAGGAEVNCIRSDGLTPLMVALSEVHISYLVQNNISFFVLPC